MTIYTRLVIDSPLTADGFKSQCDLAPLSLPALNNFQDYMAGIISGNQLGALAFKVAAVKASGTIVIASTGPTNSQTGTICGVTWTAKTSGAAAAAEWTLSTTPSVSAASLAAAINAYVAFQGMVSAEASSGTVTITCTVPGKVGNGLVMASVNWSNTTVTSFASGTDGTAYDISRL